MNRTFEWLDEKKGSRKLTKVPAMQFIDASLTQIQKQLRDERVFPTKFGLLRMEGVGVWGWKEERRGDGLGREERWVGGEGGRVASPSIFPPGPSVHSHSHPSLFPALTSPGGGRKGPGGKDGGRGMRG